jgi:hypothetical protein
VALGQKDCDVLRGVATELVTVREGFRRRIAATSSKERKMAVSSDNEEYSEYLRDYSQEVVLD